ncbi:MAG: 6,7-dimethyl-8-ribityllumazine synthase [Pseudohongiellaceae bacterium]
MGKLRTITGSREPDEANFAIVAAQFNSFIVDRLIDGALETLKQHGVQDENIEIIRVPGAFELPLVTSKAIATGRYDAVIALGAVVRGGTPHFEYVSAACVDGLNRVCLDTGVPVTLGVLTVDNLEQAIERTGPKAGNKGEEAALAALDTLSVIRKLES